MDQSRLEHIFTTFNSLSKEPKTELSYTNNFTLAVAVILSAQSTDISVNKATKTLFEFYKTPEDFLRLGEENLKSYIKTIGLYNAKAKNIMAFSKALVENHGSEVPNSFGELIKLPGVGRKTANVILNQAFSMPVIAVDTHVARVASRLGLTKEKLPDKIERDLMINIPHKWLKNTHNWLVLHGRYICKARKPECKKCPVAQYCDFYNKNQLPKNH